MNMREYTRITYIKIKNFNKDITMTTIHYFFFVIHIIYIFWGNILLKVKELVWTIEFIEKIKIFFSNGGNYILWYFLVNNKIICNFYP